MNPLLLLVPVLLGWNSDANGKAGAAATGEVWTNEHRDLYAAALKADGITDANWPMRLFVGGGEDTRATVTDWAAVVRAVQRPYTPAMFADLPDFSFSVANWLDGNEHCPLSGWSTAACYDPASAIAAGSTSWLVAGLNSSHFLPQAQAAWRTYHTLALDTAARCKQLSAAFTLPPGRGYTSMSPTILGQCESEALMFEGVAQHYQQDAWSTGHMWQRWGSADIQDWGELPIGFARALLVGTLSGFVHGLLPSSPLCAPGPEVLFSPGGISTPLPGVGDKHLEELAALSPLQARRLNDCVMGSLDEVIAALPGALRGVSGGRTHPGASCFAQRVTNEALRTTLMVASPNQAAAILSFFARVKIEWTGVDLGSVSDVARDELVTQARRDMVAWANAVSASRFAHANPPMGTNLAEGKLLYDDGTSLELQMLGMKPNGAYESHIGSLVTYDPPVAAVTGTQAVSGEQAAAAQRLRYGMYLAHPEYWCAQDLAGEIRKAADRCRDTRLPEETRAAHCQVCGGLGGLDLRQGYSPEQPSLYSAACEALTTTASKTRLFLPLGIATQVSLPQDTVEAWCRRGCASRLRMVSVNAAGAGVNSDAVLTPYSQLLEDKKRAWLSKASYYYSTGQNELGKYHEGVARSLGEELSKVASLLTAARAPDKGQAFWGSYPPYKYNGPLGGFVVLSGHSIFKTPGPGVWDAFSYSTSFGFELSNGGDQPFQTAGYAKLLVNETTGAPFLMVRNMLFGITSALDAAKLKVSVDGKLMFTLNNVTTSAEEFRIPLSLGAPARLTFDIEALGRSEDTFNPAYDKPLSFRLLALDLAVETPVESPACGLL